MLSVVITAWNEAAALPRAISSVKSIAGEIVVVVDAASTDSTAAVAKKAGAKVYSHPHAGIVEPMRNFSIGKARGDWILLLDADEELPASLSSRISNILSRPQADYYRLPRKNLIFGRWIQSAHWWPDYVYRLFKKGAVTWDDAIHSEPFTRGSGSDLPPEEKFALIHHHYASVSQYVDRLNRYTDHQCRRLLDSGYSFSWTDLVSRPAREFLNQFFARGGYREGVHGLALSLLQAFSELVLYLKLWQNSGFVPESLDLAGLTLQLSHINTEFKWWLYQTKIDNAPFWCRPFLKIARKLHA